MFVWHSVCQVYTGSWGDHDGIIRCKLGEVVHYELGEEPEPRREAPVFDKPTRGTSVEKFREMVFNHLKVKGFTWIHIEPDLLQTFWRTKARNGPL